MNSDFLVLYRNIVSMKESKKNITIILTWVKGIPILFSDIIEREVLIFSDIFEKEGFNIQ